MTDAPPQKPSAARLFGGTAAVMNQWYGDYRKARKCSSVGCCHLRYRDERQCLGHLVLDLRERYHARQFDLRLAQITGTTTPRRLAGAIRERIENEGLSQGEWAAQVGVSQSIAPRAIRDPDNHMSSFIRIAGHFGFERLADGSFRKRQREAS